jgi:hypothetical protein
VIFISAKEKELIPISGRVSDINNPDFSNEEELLKAILTYGGWIGNREVLENLSIQEIRDEVKAFFDISSCLIVLDDIDTLTTKGVDSGADYLYRVLCRAACPSKVIYTLRNAPSQSLMNAVEVPALDDDEYDEFIDACVTQFKVPPPPVSLKDTQIAEVSERRPLVVETIVALVRTAGSYERALELFQQHAGDNIRDYVFLREWEAIKGKDLAQLLLAALSDFQESATFSDLQAVLQVDSSRVRDAIAEVREMFLSVEEAGQDSRYGLATLTKKFVSTKKIELPAYAIIRERAKTYNRTVQVSNPRVASIVTQIERLLPKRFQEHLPERAFEARRIVEDKSLPPMVTQDPMFRAVVGYVYCCLPVPDLISAREAFQDSIILKHEPDAKYVLRWYYAERNSGYVSEWPVKVADIVVNGRKYEDEERINMLQFKATSLYSRGRHRIITETTDALSDYTNAAQIHLSMFRRHVEKSDYRAEKSEEYARNTLFQLFQALSKGIKPWELFDYLKEIISFSKIYIDPIELPLIEAIQHLERTVVSAEARGRTRSRLKSIQDQLSVRDKWLAQDAMHRTLARASAFDEALGKR